MVGMAIRAPDGANKRWTPLTCTECGMNRGVGDNVWMFQCSSNTPPTPLLISACNNTILFRNLPHPHPTQFSTSPISHSILYCKNTKLDPSLGNAIATSTDSSNSLREFLFAPIPSPPPSVDEAGMSPLPGIAN